MFVIIDGSSLLTTAYYGTLPKEILNAGTEEEKKAHYDKILHAKDGTFTNAVYTMSKTLIKINNEQKPTHMAILFDKSRETFRRFMYPGYKAQRGETPKPLKDQFILMERILKDSGFITLYSESVEADDYAGSITETFKGQLPIRLISKDHDYMQLVDDENDVKLWLLLNSKDQLTKTISLCGNTQDYTNKPDRSYECGNYEVKRIEGVLPTQIPDKKGICGDTSDNIPGIKGISDKTAIPLLEKFNDLDTILHNLDTLSEEEWKTTIKEIGLKRNPAKLLREGRETGRLSVDLATIRRNVKVPEDLNSYNVSNIHWNRFLSELKALNINL